MPLFAKLIGYLQSQPKNFKVKQTPDKLYISIPNVKDVDVAYTILNNMKQATL
jgi:hypothetical protein